LGLLLLVGPALSSGQEKQDTDKLEKQRGVTGIYRGWYYYPDGGPSPVSFQLVLVQNGGTVAGFIKEPNTFGARREPWLSAVLKGKYDAETGKLTLTKIYDGTAGPDHDVQYTGSLSKDGKKVEGDWDINGAGGRFTLDKVKDSKFGPLSGVWTGSYEYPAGEDRKPVDFQAVVVHHGKKVFGFLKERDTFAKSEEPWLHSTLRGRFDGKTGKLTFTKTYDGTAGQDHEAEFTGERSRDKKKVEGTWTAGEGAPGRFTIQKQPLNEKTLESLK
jgi:hypothetical protein